MKYYNDPTFSYPDFWKGREYEHQAELLAIRTLLDGKQFETIADIGGGYGRLVDTLSEYGEKMFVVDPAFVQLDLVKDFTHTLPVLIEGNSEHTGLEDESCDLVVMVRVAHHLLHPKPSFHEIARILKPKGLFLFEFANSTNLKARVRNGFGPMLLSPMDLGSTNIAVPFVNHHPASIKRALKEEGFVLQKELSVSNFRSPLLKQVIPTNILLKLEELLQAPLATMRFGPSIFILAQLKQKD